MAVTNFPATAFAVSLAIGATIAFAIAVLVDEVIADAVAVFVYEVVMLFGVSFTVAIIPAVAIIIAALCSEISRCVEAKHQRHDCQIE